MNNIRTKIRRRSSKYSFSGGGGGGGRSSRGGGHGGGGFRRGRDAASEKVNWEFVGFPRAPPLHEAQLFDPLGRSNGSRVTPAEAAATAAGVAETSGVPNRRSMVEPPIVFNLDEEVVPRRRRKSGRAFTEEDPLPPPVPPRGQALPPPRPVSLYADPFLRQNHEEDLFSNHDDDAYGFDANFHRRRGRGDGVGVGKKRPRSNGHSPSASSSFPNGAPAPPPHRNIQFRHGNNDNGDDDPAPPVPPHLHGSGVPHPLPLSPPAPPPPPHARPVLHASSSPLYAKPSHYNKRHRNAAALEHPYDKIAPRKQRQQQQRQQQQQQQGNEPDLLPLESPFYQRPDSVRTGSSFRSADGRDSRCCREDSYSRFLSADRQRASDHYHPLENFRQEARAQVKKSRRKKNDQVPSDNDDGKAGRNRISALELRRARLNRHATLPSRQAKHFSWSPVEDEEEKGDHHLMEENGTQKEEEQRDADKVQRGKLRTKPARRSKSDQGEKVIAASSSSAAVVLEGAAGSDVEPLLREEEDSSESEEEKEDYAKNGDVGDVDLARAAAADEEIIFVGKKRRIPLPITPSAIFLEETGAFPPSPI